MRSFLASILVLSSGCAVGYGVGVQSQSIKPDKDAPAGTPSSKLSMTYQEFRLIDTTGILLAGLVNAGRQYNAREQAVRDAAYKPRNQDGTVTVEYSYKPMPILSGLLTDMRIRVPLGTPTTDGDVEVMGLEYWAFNVRPEAVTFRPVKSLPMVSSIFFSVDAETIKNGPGGDTQLFMLDMDFGAATSYVIRDNVTATARASFGILSPLFAALTGGSYFNPNLELEAGWTPWSSDKLGIMISGNFNVGRDNFDREIFATRFGVNAAITFGNQSQRRGKGKGTSLESTPAPMPAINTGQPTPVAIGDQPLSGFVCLGNTPEPECPRIVESAPEAVKLFFISCAQATLEAGKTGNFGTQPKTCRDAGRAIASLIKQGTSFTPAQRRLAQVASAAAYDLSAAGYEATAGRLSADHCAMVEATRDQIYGADPVTPVLPNKTAAIDNATTQCRAKFSCTFAQDGSIGCVENAPVTPPPTETPPAPAPAPATSSP